MTDNKLQKELNRLAQYNLKYKAQLLKVIGECKNRFGYEPGEVDCDYFIDTYCVGVGNMSVNKLKEQMEVSVDRYTDKEKRSSWYNN